MKPSLKHPPAPPAKSARVSTVAAATAPAVPAKKARRRREARAARPINPARASRAELGEAVCTLENVTLFQRGQGAAAQYTIRDDMNPRRVRRNVSRAEIQTWVVERTIGETWAAEDFDAGLPKWPCHRLAPRSHAEARELAVLTGNLGTHLASCVYVSGDVTHLYQRGCGFFLVIEAVGVAVGRKRYALGETLWHHRVMLADYVKRRPHVSFDRGMDFEAISIQEAADWAEETGTAAGLPLEVRERLFGKEEANGTGKGRLILEFDRGGGRRIYARCGVFTCEELATGKVWPITRADVLSLFRFEFFNPLLDRKLPRSFRYDFAIEESDAKQAPAEPADVLIA